MPARVVCWSRDRAWSRCRSHRPGTRPLSIQRLEHQVTARLIIRRVRALNTRAARGQDELFPLWRYHAVLTDSPRAPPGPARRRAVHRADAPLEDPGPGPAGTRRLGRRHRDDPRRRPRRGPRRRPRAEGRRASQPVQPREISFTAARRAVIAAIRSGYAGYQALASTIGKCRVVTDRNRHRARKTKARPAFPGAGRDTATRTAQAVITVCNIPA